MPNLKTYRVQHHKVKISDRKDGSQEAEFTTFSLGEKDHFNYFLNIWRNDRKNIRLKGTVDSQVLIFWTLIEFHQNV